MPKWLIIFLIGAVIGPLVLKFANVILWMVGLACLAWIAQTYLTLKMEEEDENGRNSSPPG